MAGWLDKYNECDSCKAEKGKTISPRRQAVLDKANEIFNSPNNPYSIPQNVVNAGGNSNYVCIQGVCGVLSDAGIIPKDYYTNTKFAEKAPSMGFSRALADIELMQPGDIIQHMDNTNKKGVKYPSHAEIFKGINSDGDYEFYDYYDKYNGFGSIRTYTKKQLEYRFDAFKNKDNSKIQAQFFSLTPEEIKPKPLPYPFNLKKPEQEQYFNQTHAADTEYYLTDDITPTNPLEYKRSVNKNQLVDYFNDKKLDEQLRKKLKISDQDLQKSKELVYGIMDQETDFGAPDSFLRDLKYKLKGVLNSKDRSTGPAAVKLSSVSPEVRKEFGIEKARDLYDVKNAYIAALDVLNKGAKYTEGHLEGHPGLQDKSLLESGLYWYNNPSNIVNTDLENQGLIKKNAHWWQTNKDVENKIKNSPLNISEGSYPSKVIEQSKALGKHINFEDMNILPEVIVTPIKEEMEYGGEVNNNDFSISAPEGWVGSGSFNKGRDYSPAWGGQFADGGEVGDDKYVDPEHTDIHRKIDIGIDALKNVIYNNPIAGAQARIITGALSKGSDLLETAAAQFYKNQTPEQKEKLFQKYRPIDYPNFISGLARNLQPNVKPRMDDKGNYAIEEEAWRKAMQLPVKSNYIRESKYRPTSAKDPNAKYYTFHPNVIDSQKLIDYATSDAWDKNKKLSKNGREYLQMSSFAPFMKQDFIDRQSLEENQKVSDIDPLQRFQIFKGYDPKKKKNYISISDTYDFDFKPIKEVTKPYDIYDRFYYANDGSLPGAVGFMYARTQSPAPSNGPYAKKTKASAENGTEMKFYQEGLDFKPKTISEDGISLDFLDYPQKKAMELLTGKEQKPSDWIKGKGYFNRDTPRDKAILFGADVIADPLNLLPVAKLKYLKGLKGLVPDALNSVRKVYNTGRKSAQYADNTSDLISSFEQGGQLEKLDQLTNFTNYNTKQPGGWLDKYEG